MDFIRGDKFEQIADFVFAPPRKRMDDYSGLQNTFTLDKSKWRDPCLIYTHTFYVNDLFDLIDDLQHKFVVITHNCDMNITIAPPKNVIRWYAQNVNIIHDRVESIPIGLQNRIWSRYGDKETIMLNKLKETRNYRNLLYINHNVDTNPVKREGIYELFRDKPWVTLDYKTKNFENFDKYIDNIYNHKFVICPEGNGIDTHRIWECLYMGTIPIVEDNINNQFFKYNLPMIVVDEWSDITKEWLNYQKGWMDEWDYSPQMLTFEYWKNKIRDIK